MAPFSVPRLRSKVVFPATCDGGPITIIVRFPHVGAHLLFVFSNHANRHRRMVGSSGAELPDVLSISRKA